MSERLRTLLAAYKGGELSEDDVLAEVARAPYEAFTIGRFDADREARAARAHFICRVVRKRRVGDGR